MPECPHCGYPANPAEQGECPKCSADLRHAIFRGVFEVDIVHQGETWEQAREKLLRALDYALLHGHKGLKVIHGHGANSGRAVIANHARALMKAQARRYGGRMANDIGNPGASLLWLNR